MKLTDYTYLLNRPEVVDELQVKELEDILFEFPYFQSALALRLKALYSQNSFRYNLELKKTAAQTTDRTVLFEFITSDKFRGFSHGFFERKKIDLHQIEVLDVDVVSPDKPKQIDGLKQSIISSINSIQNQEDLISDYVDFQIDFNHVESVQTVEEEKLEIGKPIEFTNSDSFSFQEWLQLTKFKPIVREEEFQEEIRDVHEENEIKNKNFSEISSEKLKKLELIDKFIESNPKIIPDRNAPVTSVLDSQSQDSSMLMTETLAKVYLEQKKYQKAIEAYEILILKYPEKSAFFADRIDNVKKLQQNNS